MEKRIITNATLQALLDSDLVFEKQIFENKVNQLLMEHDLELHEKTSKELLGLLEDKGYIELEDNLILKTSKTLLNKNNKQRKIYEMIFSDYSSEFDQEYIQKEFEKTIRKQEQTPVQHQNLISNCFQFYANEKEFSQTNAKSDLSF